MYSFNATSQNLRSMTDVFIIFMHVDYPKRFIVKLLDVILYTIVETLFSCLMFMMLQCLIFGEQQYLL